MIMSVGIIDPFYVIMYYVKRFFSNPEPGRRRKSLSAGRGKWFKYEYKVYSGHVLQLTSTTTTTTSTTRTTSSTSTTLLLCVKSRSSRPSVKSRSSQYSVKSRCSSSQGADVLASN